MLGEMARKDFLVMLACLYDIIIVLLQVRLVNLFEISNLSVCFFSCSGELELY